MEFAALVVAFAVVSACVVGFVVYRNRARIEKEVAREKADAVASADALKEKVIVAFGKL